MRNNISQLFYSSSLCDPDLGFWRVDARPSGREQGSQPWVALPEFGWEASL